MGVELATLGGLLMQVEVSFGRTPGDPGLHRSLTGGEVGFSV